jgi:hypothetical protein
MATLAVWAVCVAVATVTEGFPQGRASEIGVAVRDATGRGVAGVEVIAVSGDWHSVATDAHGQVRLQVTPGTWEITALHAELAILPTTQTATVRPGETAAIEFRALPRSAQIRGTVRFRSDPPPALRGLHAVAYAAALAPAPLPVSAVPLAEDRSFALAVPPGRWRLGLLEIPHGTAAHDVTVERGHDAQVDLEVDFRGLTGVTGLVFEAGLITDRLGPVFSLTTVGLYAIGSNGAHRILAVTQAAGNQTFGVFAAVPAGTPLGVFAWRPGGTAVPAAVRSAAAPGSASFADFRFVVNSGTLVGTVVDSAGRPAADAWVATVSGVRYEEWMMWGKPVHAPGGVFTVRVPLGPVLVRAWRDTRRMGTPVRVPVGSTHPLSVRLEAP